MTVVNGLYLIQAARLSLAEASNGTAQRDGRNLFQFFKSWITNPHVSGAHKLQSPATGLIQERVSTYKNKKAVYWWDPYTAKLSDQGLVMAGLLLMPNRSKEDVLFGKDVAEKICKGVLTHMVDSDGMIQPWYPIGEANKVAYDPGTFSSGVGVYMRYLLYGLWHGDETMKACLQAPGHTKMVIAAADASVAGTFPIYGNKFFGNLNQLATLLLAHSLLPVSTC